MYGYIMLADPAMLCYCFWILLLPMFENKTVGKWELHLRQTKCVRFGR